MSALRHPAFVRANHWLITIPFFALLVSGCELVLSHPRFYCTLPVPFGGPLRIRVPRQLGYKSVKFVDRVFVTDLLDGTSLGSGQYAWYVGI